MMRVPFLMLLAAVASACSVNDLALQQMNFGQHAAAFANFQQCANRGEPACINNIGLMYERGFVNGKPNVEMAISYYILAARMGNTVAQQNLVKLGQSVPPTDLQWAYQQRVEQERLESERAAAAVAQLFAPRKPIIIVPQQPAVQLSTNTAATTADCTNDFQCGVGNRCVRPSGTYGKGHCVQPVNQYGVKTYEVPEPAAGPRDVPGCSFTTNCPVGFQCIKQSGELYGLCLKP